MSEKKCVVIALYDMNSAHCKALASVMVWGFDTLCSTIWLAPPFIAYCFKVGDDLCCIPPPTVCVTFSGNIFQKWEINPQHAPKNYPSVEQDDLLEVLGSQDVKIVASEAHTGDIVDEMAHRELLQAPAYIRNAWKDVSYMVWHLFLEP